jgi:hypothetical protein
MQREQMNPEIVHSYRDSSLRGSMQTQSEHDLRESQLAKRDSRSFRLRSLLGLVGRETSSGIVIHIL